jgi:hypothetical protein
VPKNHKQRLRKKYERAEKFGRALCAVAGVHVHPAPGCVELIYPYKQSDNTDYVSRALHLVVKRPIDERTWERKVKEITGAQCKTPS